MTMHETADIIASDKLHNIQHREIAELRRENAELIRRLSANSDDIEIHRGKVVFVRGNDTGRNPARLAASKTPAPAHTRIG